MQTALKGLMKGFQAKPHMLRRIATLLVSVTLMGFCVAVFDRIGWGTDMFSCLNLGVSRMLGMRFGDYQLIVNIVLLAFVLWKGPDRIGLGTLANMTLVGYSADFFLWVIGKTGMDPANVGFMGKSLIFLPTMALFLVAAAFYLVVDLGASPYDSVPQILSGWMKKIPFMWVRIGWDTLFILLGLLTHSDVGIVTVAIAFGLGPVIAAIAGKCKKMFA